MPIICGTDLSPASGGALEVAHALAGQRGDRELVLVHVAPADSPDLPELRRKLDAQARASVATGPAVRAELIIGPSDQALVQLAETLGASLIVIAAQSRSHPASRLGTTAAQVIARTHVPVIAVRGWSASTADGRQIDDGPRDVRSADAALELLDTMLTN
jgi:nucleotide-binding universal stress UspA family protein